MKTLLILLVTAIANGDKLNTLYLPPIGANYSGGSSGDIEVPFQVPAESYTTSTDELPNKLTTRFEPSRDFDGRGSAIYAPTIVPSSTSKSVSYYTTPLTDRRNYNQFTQELSNQPTNNVTYTPTQYSDLYNSDKNIPSITNVLNQFEDTSSADETPSLFSANKGKSPINSGQIGVPENVNYVRYPERVIRPQAEADRNAVILNYSNILTPEAFSYSYDTSNGIHADESGTATDGVKANGSYSYIGDDGKLYNITYSADENGFQPRGDHLPTSPPIPDAILKVIEQAAKDKINGIFDDGSYDEKKYGYQKYQNPQSKIKAINKPTLVSTRRNNSGSYKQPENGNNNNSNIGNLKSRDKNYSPFYTLEGNKSYGFNTRPSSNDQDDIYDNRKQKADDSMQLSMKGNIQGNDLEKAYEYYQNRDSNSSDFPEVKNLENEPGYEYKSPRNKFESGNIDTFIPKNVSTFNKNKVMPPYEYNESYTPQSNINEQLYLTDFDRNYKNKMPYIGTDDETKGLNKATTNENRYTESENGYTYPNTEYQFGQRIPSQTSTSAPSSTESIKEFSTKPYRPTDYYGPSSTERIKQIVTSTDQPNDFYDPSSTGKTKQFGTYTDRPNYFYGPSSTEGIKQIGKYTDHPTDSYGPSSTEGIKQIGKYTDRPTDFYGPSSTEGIKQIGIYTDRPNDFYSPSSTERIKQIDTYTDRPKEFYGPSFTGRIKQLGTYTDRPTDFYGSSSTERIKQIDTYTDRPTDFYGPSSTERIKQIDTYTDRPTDFYGPSSTERLKEIDTYTDRPKEFDGPSFTGRIKQLGTYTDGPTDFYGPSSTERIKQIDTYTDRPTDFYGPSSTGRIKQLGTYTDRPNDFYGPSSTERIKQIDTYTDRPKDFYNPSSTEGIKQFGTYTNPPTDFYSPSSTERIKQFGTYTDRPNDFYGPSTTEKIIGEDFVGPKQLQTYDPATGYHY